MLPVAILVPPTLATAAFGTWSAGHATALARLEPPTPPETSASAVFAGLASSALAYGSAGRLVFPLVDAAGGERRIVNFGDFARSAGPPTLARCGAIVAAFFVGGAASGATSVYLLGPQKNPRSRR